jgi:hypothetical protein
LASSIDYYPEIPTGPQFKFSQSKKWLKDLAPEHHAQMCSVEGEHYYIFEPLELLSKQIVIPIHFYLLDSQLYSKCIQPTFREYSINNQKCLKIKIPENIQFDDPTLLIINTNQFQKPYSDILIHGKKLSEECCNTLYGM